jgi:hypothetical protein
MEEEYYDFLSLQGLAERPALNYRTFSDSVWALEKGADGNIAPHPWQGQSFSAFRPLFNGVKMRIYGPELFMSGNTAAPYGQNDGALWQGRGFNASFTGGVRFEGYGVEATFKPQLAFSQNAAFDMMPPSEEMVDTTVDKAVYRYFWGTVDAPQRFGDKPFFVYDWGDSEIRYTWKTFTVGFGTQAIWLGPAQINPILHSNNAPTYPKIDIGLRRQSVTIPWLNWNVGDVEARLWVGKLTESAYFDDDSTNDHTMFHGLSFAYTPPFLYNLTLLANRVCLVPWAWENFKYILPSDNNTIEDQKASFGASWVFPQVGFEVYGELGIDDYVTNGIFGWIRHPFHSTVYTAGLKKQIKLSSGKQRYGELIFESNWMEMTQDFQLQWNYDFYFHGLIRQGYTNKGEWLGNGNSHGGNSQYIRFNVYYLKGKSGLFISRNNPDNNFIFKEAINASAIDGNLNKKYHSEYKANFIAGADTSYFITSFLTVSGGIIYNLIINPHYYLKNESIELMHNFSFQVSVKWVL